MLVERQPSAAAAKATGHEAEPITYYSQAEQPSSAPQLYPSVSYAYADVVPPGTYQPVPAAQQYQPVRDDVPDTGYTDAPYVYADDEGSYQRVYPGFTRQRVLQPMTDDEMDQFAARSGDQSQLTTRHRTIDVLQSLFEISLINNHIGFAQLMAITAHISEGRSVYLTAEQFNNLITLNSQSASLKQRANLLGILKFSIGLRMQTFLDAYENHQPGSICALYTFAFKLILDAKKSQNPGDVSWREANSEACFILNELLHYECDKAPEYKDRKFIDVWRQLSKSQQESLVQMMLEDKDARVREGLQPHPEVSNILSHLFEFAAEFGWAEQDMFADPDIKAEAFLAEKPVSTQLSSAFCGMFSLRRPQSATVAVTDYAPDALKATVVTSVSILIALAASEAMFAGAIIGFGVYATTALIATLMDSSSINNVQQTAPTC